MGRSQLPGSQHWGLPCGGPADAAALCPSVLQITSGSAGKEVLTSIFSATAETLSTSTTTHVTKVRAAPKAGAGGFLLQATGICGGVGLYRGCYGRKCPSPPYEPKKCMLSRGGW